jgi:hypothetical protein
VSIGRNPLWGLRLVKQTKKTAYFQVDEIVPDTGVYRVFHSGHRLSHEALLLKDTHFPRCVQCGDSVHFEFLDTVPGLDNDADFLSRRVFEIRHPEEQANKKRLA